MSFAILFSHSGGCLLVLLIVSFAVQKLFTLMMSQWFIFACVSLASADCLVRSCCGQGQRGCCLCSPLDPKGHMHPSVYSSVINNSQSMETAQVPIDEWMDSEDVLRTHTHIHTHTHAEISLSDRKQWNLAICNNVDGTRVCYSKWNKSEEDRYMISLRCGI